MLQNREILVAYANKTGLCVLQLVNYVISRDGDLKRVQGAYQAKLKELEIARKQNAELAEEIEGMKAKGVLRHRKGEGSKTGDSDKHEHDSVELSQAQAGFAMWHLVLVGLVMLLVGRLIS